MCAKPSTILENQDKMMTATTMFRQLALPLQPGDSVKAQINRAAREAGFGYSRGKTLWYGLCRLWQDEHNQLCDAYERHLNKRERQLEQEIALVKARRSAREMERRQYAFTSTNPASLATVSDSTGVDS